MIKLTVTEETIVILNGKEITLTPQVYKTDDEKFCKENDFIKCHKCKGYFDYGNEFGQFHEQYKKRKDKSYCDECFNSLNP